MDMFSVYISIYHFILSKSIYALLKPADDKLSNIDFTLPKII